MPRYRIVLSEAAFYRVAVEAATEEEAERIALSRRVPLGITPYDFAPLRVRSVTFLSDTPRRAKYRKQSRKRRWILK
jgi:hypothetical protein